MTEEESMRESLKKALKEIFEKNKGKFFVKKDLIKTLGIDYDIWPSNSEFYKILNDIHDDLKLTKRKYSGDGKGRSFEYSLIINTKNLDNLSESDDKRFDQITNNIQKMSIALSSIKSLMLDMPSKISTEITNIISERMTKKILEELGEFFQDFVKDHSKIQEDLNSLHKQNGMIISLIKGIKVKQQLLGSYNNGKIKTRKKNPT